MLFPHAFSNIYTPECSIDVKRDILMYIVRAGRATRADDDDDDDNDDYGVAELE
jgi:hypothetical protein